MTALGDSTVRPGLLFHPSCEQAPGRPDLSLETVSEHYGAKVAGIWRLPDSFTPPYAALPTWLFQAWLANARRFPERSVRRAGITLRDAISRVTASGKFQLIVRSSAQGESLDDRGLYLSKVLAHRAPLSDIVQAIEQIYRQFLRLRRHAAMGICLQRFVVPELAGHLSNELRLSPTRNQWKYEIEYPSYAPNRGLNSKFAELQKRSRPIQIRDFKSIGSVLRRVARTVNSMTPLRSHLEWCCGGGQLWVLQFDVEAPETEGIDPRNEPRPATLAETGVSRTVGIFDRYDVSENVIWPKLQNIHDFWVDGDPPKHRLYFCSGDKIQAAMGDGFFRRSLASEVEKLTAGRAVIRTDCLDTRISRLNLPRTDTVSATDAVRWIRTTIAFFVHSKVSLSDTCFIIHAFIPARAAAWSYFTPGDPIVHIDSLWGLPDGLQFLPHDSFQCSAKTGATLSDKVRYKPSFLREQENGTWAYVPIARQFTRMRSLDAEGLQVVARQTVKIAEKIKEPAQIMWFCGVPEKTGLPVYLPWYRSKLHVPLVEQKRPPFRTVVVRNVGDLKRLPKSDEPKLIVRVSPDPELVREDDGFLKGVIRIARQNKLPVEIAGSVLGHAYYKLAQSGVMVVVADPYAQYYRSRGRKEFRKLVRDAVPDAIEAGGEVVRSTRLVESEVSLALIAKVFEEAMECLSAGSTRDLTEELADLFEVVRAIGNASGIEWDIIMSAAEKKRKMRGGFDAGTILLETSFQRPVKGDKSQDTHPAVSPRELGIVRTGRDGVVVPFPRMLTGVTTPVEITIGDQRLHISTFFSKDGVVIKLRLVPSRIGAEATQLELRLAGDGE